MRLLTFLAKRFVAGDTMEEAGEAVKKLNSSGIKATLDILGENVAKKEDAIKARDGYLNLLDFIDRSKLDSNVSLKLTMLGLDLDPKFCEENLRMIVKKAKSLSNFVRVDMEGTPYTQVTLDVFNNVYKEFKGNVGIVIQAYLFRSEEDIKFLNSLHVPVRLCKGAYKEPANLAIKDMKEIRKNFLGLSKKLLENGGYPAFATHDPFLIDEIKNYIASKNVSKDKFEFQMLYGVRRKLSKRLADEGYKVRLYVPYGTHWLPYTIRRLRERKENVFFVVKSFFTD
jgi:proline dehydrogenase